MDTTDDIDESLLAHSKEELLSIANSRFGVNLDTESPERHFFDLLMAEYSKLYDRCEDLHATSEVALRGWTTSDLAIREERHRPGQDNAEKGLLPAIRPILPFNYDGPWPTVQENTVPSPPPDQPMLVLHKVRCDEYHKKSYSSSSPVETIFFDVPQKITGDILDGCLKGHSPVLDIADFLKGHAHVSIIVYRIYDCTKYCTALSKLAWKIGFRERQYRWSGRTLTGNGPVAEYNSEEIYIANMGFHNSLRKALEEHPSQSGVGTPFPQSIDSPFPVLFHYGAHFRSHFEVSDLHHPLLECLLTYVYEHYHDQYSEARDLFSKHQIKPCYLNLLISPGDVLYTVENGHARGYMASGWPEKSQISTSWFIDCWFWAFNGKFWKAPVSLIIGKFEASDPETYPIAGLETFPIIYTRTLEVDCLRFRGNKFWEFHNKKYVRYCDPEEQARSGNETFSSRFMVDYETYKKLHPTAHPFALAATDTSHTTTYDFPKPPDDQFVLLLPPHLHGYNLHHKEWITLGVDNIEPIPWDKKAFERLVLEPSTKGLIKALVSIHIETDKSADIISGKGNGLIVLLHGGPGTGKTLTAESVAELAERPLYRITCGDIGTDPEAVEKYLETILYIGKMWNCVILLDEADVFLEERGLADLERNALVSIFLRVLEYYEGILILTSNRVGSFDEAFKSRIQLAIHYPDLEQAERMAIWRMFFAVLQENKVLIDIDDLEDNVTDLSKNVMNGRQIRNAVTTGSMLGRYKKEPFAYKHLQRVMKTADAFEKYIEGTRGHTYVQYAKAEGLRA